MLAVVLGQIFGPGERNQRVEGPEGASAARADAEEEQKSKEAGSSDDEAMVIAVAKQEWGHKIFPGDNGVEVRGRDSNGFTAGIGI